MILMGWKHPYNESVDENLKKGHRQRLKKRFLEAGAGAFNERDLLELLLGYALARIDTKPIAASLLQRYGSLEGVLGKDPETLAAHPGLGEHSAVLLSLAGALLSRPPRSLKGTKVSGPSDVEDVLLRRLGSKPEESFVVLLLDQGNRVMDLISIEEGIENRANVYPKRVVRLALDRHATGVICVHNHPSGSGDFSTQDVQLTERLGEVLEAVEVRLLDHFLVADGEVLSMRSQGQWPL